MHYTRVCVLFRFTLWQHSNCRRQPRTQIGILPPTRSGGEICMSESNATVLTACRAHYLHTDDRNDAGDVWEWMNWWRPGDWVPTRPGLTSPDLPLNHIPNTCSRPRCGILFWTQANKIAMDMPNPNLQGQTYGPLWFHLPDTHSLNYHIPYLSIIMEHLTKLMMV